MSNFSEGHLNPDEGINFARAQKLPGGGSTCDIYKAVWHRKKVFVKRLKPKFRHMPIYLAAFDKEYDIGANLKHQFLPDYCGFFEDYIIMDFIDGKTLAELIKEKDPWLAKEKNVKRMLRQLLEVVDYLHQHNVVHCDIKADNIMITAGNRNLMLIDLDKCYTDWLDDTSGDPSKYSVTPDKKGHKSIDFHGIGILTGNLLKNFKDLPAKSLLKFSQECMKEDPEIDNLQALLTDKTPSRLLWLWVLPAVGAAVAAIILLRPHPNQLQAETLQPSVSKDTVVIYHENLAAGPNILQAPEKTPSNPPAAKPSKPDYKKDIEKGMSVRLTQMIPLFDKAEELLADSLTSDQALLDITFEMVNLHSGILQDAYNFYEEKYPDIDAIEIQMAVAHCVTHNKLTDRWNKIQKRITDTMVSRHPDSYSD